MFGLSGCLSLCLSVCLVACPVYLSVCLSMNSSIRPSISPCTVGRRAVGALNDTPVEFKVELRGVRPGTYPARFFCGAQTWNVPGRPRPQRSRLNVSPWRRGPGRGAVSAATYRTALWELAPGPSRRLCSSAGRANGFCPIQRPSAGAAWRLHRARRVGSGSRCRLLCREWGTSKVDKGEI